NNGSHADDWLAGGPFSLLQNGDGLRITTAGGNFSFNPGFGAHANKAMDFRFDVDLAANGGDGAVSFFWRENGQATWQTDATLQNLTLALSSASTTWNAASKWTGWYSEMHANSILSDVMITVPEPTSLALLTLGAAVAMYPRRARSAA